MHELSSAHEATRPVLCKAVDCEREALAKRGPYALLCADHSEEARAARTARPAAPLSSPGENAPPSIKQAAQRIIAPATELDKALARRRTARADAAAAFTTFKQALEELQQTAREALA